MTHLTPAELFAWGYAPTKFPETYPVLRAHLERVNAEREAAELARVDRLEPVAADDNDCTGDTT